MASTTWQLAPWVVRADAEGGGLHLLGPRLQLLHVGDARDLDTLDAQSAQALTADGFVIERDAGLGDGPPCTESPAPTAWIVTTRWRSEAHALVAALAAAGSSERWSVSNAWPRARAGEPPPLVVPLEALEDGRPDLRLREVLPGARVLWLGEGVEGPHVGPLLETMDDVALYMEATRNWATMRQLERLGFGERWPLSVVPALRADPGAVARAMVAVLGAPSGSCAVVGEERCVRAWSALTRRSIDPAELVSAQRWSKGMLRELAVEESAELPGLWFGSCLGPCDGDPSLESKFGKGTTAAEARETTVGEAVERFAAWLRGRAPAPRALQPGPCFALRDFHPFGAAWDRYLRRGEPELPATNAVDAVTGEVVRVPECLVAEPYEWPGGEEATGSTTSGLAAFSSRQGAIVRGAMELLERNDFYPSFLHLQPAVRIEPRALADGGRKAELRRLLEGISARDLELSLLYYGRPFRLPIVHSFLWDPEAQAMSRGAGSALDLGTAALKATIEALQIRRQHRFVAEAEIATEAAAAYRAWASPEVTTALCDYLEDQPRGGVDVPAFPSDEALHAHLAAELGRASARILVADLPCPVTGWSAVRVLVPGLTCHGAASHSAGGARLLAPAFQHPVPI